MARYSRRRVTWRDKPLYDARIPFQDGGSQLNRFHAVKKQAKKELDITKESQKRGGERKRQRIGTLKKIDYASRAGIMGYQARHLIKEGVGGKSITELMKEDLASAGNFAKRCFTRIGEAIGDGLVDAEELLASAEVPLLEAGTELAEFGILLMV